MLELRTIHVNADRCQGHNRCKLAAPALFTLDEHGNASPARDGIVSAEQMKQARLARANCQEYGITLMQKRTA